MHSRLNIFYIHLFFSDLTTKAFILPKIQTRYSSAFFKIFVLLFDVAIASATNIVSYIKTHTYNIISFMLLT